MSFSPITGLVYLPIHDVKQHSLVRTSFLKRGKLRGLGSGAANPRAGSVEQPIATNSAILSTAGNLVFQGEGTGEFAAYSADGGRKCGPSKRDRPFIRCQ